MVTGTGRKPDLPRGPAQMARFDEKIMKLFSRQSPREEKEVPSWAGAEKFAADLNFGEKTPFLLRLLQNPATRCQIEVTSLHFLL